MSLARPVPSLPVVVRGAPISSKGSAVKQAPVCLDKEEMQSPADWPVEGLLVHAAGQGKDGFRVVDLWESEEAAGRFGAIMVPILQEIGVTDMPEIYPAHTFVSA